MIKDQMSIWTLIEPETDPNVYANARAAKAAILEYREVYPGWTLTSWDGADHFFAGRKEDRRQVTNAAWTWLVERYQGGPNPRRTDR